MVLIGEIFLHSLRRDEGVFFDGAQHIHKSGLGGSGVAVIDDWQVVTSIAAAHYNQKTQLNLLGHRQEKTRPKSGHEGVQCFYVSLT